MPPTVFRAGRQLTARGQGRPEVAILDELRRCMPDGDVPTGNHGRCRGGVGRRPRETRRVVRCWVGGPASPRHSHPGPAWDLVEQYGMRRFCLGVHACDIPVLERDRDADALKVVTVACARALERDAPDAIVLGCTGMSTWGEQIAAEVGDPVVDGWRPRC